MCPRDGAPRSSQPSSKWVAGCSWAPGGSRTAVRGPKGFSVTLETPPLPEVVRVFGRLAENERLRMPIPRKVPGILVEDACRPLWPSMDGERQGQLRSKSLCHR
jgi:hypothetical protein